MKLSLLTLPFHEVKFAPGDDTAQAGCFSGHGAAFGNLDSYGDTIAKGAFKQTLKDWKARKTLPRMLLQHGGGWFGTALDGIPCGKWTDMKEDDAGLVCAGELFALNTERGTLIYEGMKAGVLSGLSIGYEAVGVTYGQKPTEPERTLTEIKLYEVSIVTFPANEAATIEDCKSHRKALDQLESLSEYEVFLREAGLSRNQATTFVSRLKKSLKQSDSDRHADVLRAANEAAAGLLSTITTRK